MSRNLTDRTAYEDLLSTLRRYCATVDLDRKYGADYYEPFRKILARIQRLDLVIGGAMTDVKCDCGKSPSQQALS
jgi:4-hydroxybutyryl-CoA dehydratase/vinylacetyl-CoA-Delta-isomerase